MKEIKPFPKNPAKLYGVLLIFLTTLVFLSSSGFEFVFLDDTSIVHDDYERISSLNKIPEAFTSNYLGGHYYRPFTVTTFIFNALTSGQHPFSYHLINLLLHILTTFFIYRILLLTGNKEYISALTSMIYGLSAIHINAVGWMAGRADLLTGFFGSAAFIFLIKYCSDRKVTNLLPTIACLIFAVLSKESAIVLPFIFSAYLLFRKDIVTQKKLFASLAFLFVVVFYLVLRNSVSDTVRTDTIALSTFFANLRVLPETLSKFFFPFNIDVLPDFSPITTSAGILIIITLSLIPLLMKDINKKNYYAGLVSFFLLMISGMFFRTMSLDGFYYWDCRSYLPLIAMIFPVSEILKSLSNKFELKKVQNPGYVYVFILAVGTIYHLPKYSDGKTFWESVIDDYPDRYLSYIGLFNYNNHNKNFPDAEENLKVALKINPSIVQYRILQINFYKSNRLYDKAFESVLEGLKFDKENIPLTQQLIKLAGITENNSSLTEILFKGNKDRKYYLNLKGLLEQEILAIQNDSTSFRFYKSLIEKTDSILNN